MNAEGSGPIARTSIAAAGAVLLLFLAAGGLPPAARSQGGCMSWGEARAAGLLKARPMRPASEIKDRIEKRYNGKVVSFEVCRGAGGLIYKLAVLPADGKVIVVTEPAH